MSDLEFYNKQDKEELVSMCIARDNKINSLEQENKQLKEQKKQAIKYINHYLKDIDNLDNVLINSILLKEVSQILGADK